jgi:hypothetical protein
MLAVWYLYQLQSVLIMNDDDISQIIRYRTLAIGDDGASIIETAIVILKNGEVIQLNGVDEMNAAMIESKSATIN